MYDLTSFTKDDMLKCAVALRNMEANAKSMEQVANRIVRYLYENFVDLQTGKPAFALVRFFKTHPYGELTKELQTANFIHGSFDELWGNATYKYFKKTQY